MKANILLLELAIMAIVSSCGVLPYTLNTDQPTRIYKPDKESHQVTFLFEQDGCLVYRFYDLGNYVYFTTCQGNVVKMPKDSTENVITNTISVSYDNQTNVPQKIK